MKLAEEKMKLKEEIEISVAHNLVLEDTEERLSVHRRSIVRASKKKTAVKDQGVRQLVI